MLKNIEICVACVRARGIKCQGSCPCPEDPDKRSVGDHAKSGYCPIGRFAENAQRPDQWEVDPAKKRQQRAPSEYHPIWTGLHRRPLFVTDLSREGIWISDFTRELRCGPCKVNWLRLLKDFPPDFTSPRDYFYWTVEAHNRVNDSLGKPRITPARAARVHGCVALLSADELATDTTPVHLLIQNRWSLGDIVVSTAPIRDLMLAYPGEFVVSVECSAPEVFEGLPVEPLGDRKPDLIWHFPVDYRAEPEGVNFCQFAVRRLAQFLNRAIPCTAVKPWLVL